MSSNFNPWLVAAKLFYTGAIKPLDDIARTVKGHTHDRRKPYHHHHRRRCPRCRRR